MKSAEGMNHGGDELVNELVAYAKSGKTFELGKIIRKVTQDITMRVRRLACLHLFFHIQTFFQKFKSQIGED